MRSNLEPGLVTLLGIEMRPRRTPGAWDRRPYQDVLVDLVLRKGKGLINEGSALLGRDVVLAGNAYDVASWTSHGGRTHQAVFTTTKLNHHSIACVRYDQGVGHRTINRHQSSARTRKFETEAQISEELKVLTREAWS